MKFKDLHINIKIRVIETFLSKFVGGMIFPFMTIYLVEHFNNKIAGILLFVNVFIGIIVTLISGYISDQYGRKSIILNAEKLRLIAFFVMLCCNSPFFQSAEITFAMMTINSICWGLANPVYQASLLDVCSPKERNYMYTITYWATNFSIAIGGIIGAFLFKAYFFQLLIALTLTTGVIVYLVYHFMEESYFPYNQKDKLNKHLIELLFSYKQVLNDKLFLLYMIAGILILTLELQLTNSIGVRLSHDFPIQTFLLWNLDGINLLGFLRTENTILVFIFALLAAKISKNIDNRKVLIVTCLVYSIGYGTMSYSNNLWILIIMMLIVTISEVFLIPVQNTYLASLPPNNARSKYMAVVEMQYNLAMVIVSLIVILQSFLPVKIVACIIFTLGFIATIIYVYILPKIEMKIKKEGDSTRQVG